MDLGEDITSKWLLFIRRCPACKKFVIMLDEKYHRLTSGNYMHQRIWRCYPKTTSRTPIGPEIPEVIAKDYEEACNTLPVSPKASAALSRRCLQHVLREKAGVKTKDLANEIQEVLDSGKLPSHLAESLDAIRNIGNFAAHPIKSTSSGEVIDVEPGEAEWNLDVLEALFDFYFTQPALTAKRRAALDAKLKDANKPAMK
jgi:hypothetical protein